MFSLTRRKAQGTEVAAGHELAAAFVAAGLVTDPEAATVVATVLMGPGAVAVRGGGGIRSAGLLSTVPESAPACTVPIPPATPQNRPQAIIQLIAAPPKRDRSTGFLELAAHGGAGVGRFPIIVAYPQVVIVRLRPGDRVSSPGREPDSPIADDYSGGNRDGPVHQAQKPCDPSG